MSPEENERAVGRDPSSGATAWWIAIGALVVIAAGLYVWKVVAVDRAEDRLERARSEWREEARGSLERRTTTLLRLAAEPLGLAVRDAAMAENYGTVGAYLDRVARIEGVRGAYFAVGDTIRVATDASREGLPLTTVTPTLAGEGGGTRVEGAEGEPYRAVVPITGLNERIGTLVLVYEPPGATGGPGGAAETVADTASGPARE